MQSAGPGTSAKKSPGRISTRAARSPSCSARGVRDDLRQVEQPAVQVGVGREETAQGRAVAAADVEHDGVPPEVVVREHESRLAAVDLLHRAVEDAGLLQVAADA